MNPAPSITTDKDIGASVRAQALVRAKLGIPVMLLIGLSLWKWGSPYGALGFKVIAVVAAIHVVYLFAALYVSTHKTLFTPTQIVAATAVLDPLLLSAWLSMLGESGALYICFYLFTILGFGFRVGTRPMWLCQAASIIGYGAVVTISPIWTDHPIFGVSNLLLLIIVPMYATVLIKKLRDARAHAESESQAKTQLLANVSHELRTPLAGIMASAQLIQDESGEDRIARRAQTILELSDELMLEINDLLDSAKLEAASLALDTAPFDLSFIADHLKNALDNTAAAKGLKLIIDVDRIDDMVVGDIHYLCRVMTNIAGNAVKFTDTGKVEVQIKLLETTTVSYRIRFSVRDTGIGIPDEYHQKIFEPFVQASGGTTRKYGGTGLGMSLAKDVVTLMGGAIVLESAPGKGSYFYFDVNLPRIAKEVADTAFPKEIRIVYGKKILVADDNQTNLKLIKELLARDRHEIFTAKSGREAIDLLNIMDFDVVYLDYNMEDMSGAMVLQLYRFGKLNPAPTYFLTADTTSSTADKLQDIGAKGILHKPITSTALRESITCLFESDAVRIADRREPSVALRSVPLQYIDTYTIGSLRQISNNPEFLSDLLATAIEDITRHCDGLHSAIGVNDVKTVRETSHALKGVCDSVGAVRLSSLLNTLMHITSDELKLTRDKWKKDIYEVQALSITGLRETLGARQSFNGSGDSF
jgi:two-component system sensor histidine kinase RpfC